MFLRTLGNSDLQCSVIGLGTWGMGGDYWGAVDDEKSIATIQAGLDAGINLIDTAPAYGKGHSEEMIGKAIKGRKREDYLIATKCGLDITTPHNPKDSRPEKLRQEVDASLQRMGLSYIDLYQVHWPDLNHPLEDAFVELDKIRKSGKVRHIGVSNFDPKQMDEASQYCPLVSLQPPYSLLKREIEEEILPYCIEKNLGVLSYGSIGAGALTGKFKERPVFEQGDRRGNFYKFFNEENWPKTAAMIEVLKAIAEEHQKPTVHVAINWVLKQKGVTVALVGARTPEQVVMNAEAGSWSLSDAENARIEAAYAKIFE